MLNRVIDFLAVIAGILLCALIALICVDVVVRNFKLFSIPWSLEVAQFMLYGMTFLAAPWVLKSGGHISVDLLVQKLSARQTRIVGRVTSLAGTFVSAILLYYSVRVILSFIAQEQLVYGALIFPKWWVYAPAPITFALMLLIFLRWMIFPETLAEANANRSDGL